MHEILSCESVVLCQEKVQNKWNNFFVLFSNSRGMTITATQIDPHIGSRLWCLAFFMENLAGGLVRMNSVGRLPKSGSRRLKYGSLLAKTDSAKQRTFFDTVLHPLMEQDLSFPSGLK